MAVSTGKKTIVVVGGTGRTGSSVALSLHDNPNFHVKVTTRDVTSGKAKRIQKAGIEVAQADSWEADQVNDAFQGAWGVMMNSDSNALDFNDGSGRTESQMGKTVIDAARKQGVSVFVFANLPEAAKVTQGAVQISTFGEKNAIGRYAQAAGFDSYVDVNVGWQMENFWNVMYEKPFGGFARVQDVGGYLTLKLFRMGNNPESTPFTSIRDDYGDIVHGVFLEPERWNLQTIWAVSHPLSFQGVVDAYNHVVGKDAARYVESASLNDAATPDKTKEVNGLTQYVDYVKGDYCNGKPLDQAPAKELKKNGALARGLSHPKTELQTMDGFIRAYAFNSEDM